MGKAHLILAGLLLAFTANATNDIPRPEYPRPQFERTEWINLNGTWTYELDFTNSGRNRNVNRSEGFEKTITVPFCPESKLSGVNYTDFINQMWYQRSIQIPEGWKEKKILLNFGAANYYTDIFIDGKFVGNHYGGNSSFSLDITRFVRPGQSHNLIVFVVNDPRSGVQTAGKQSMLPESYSCFYTRVTGIWQTVWMEAVSPQGLKSVDTCPDIDAQQLTLMPQFYQTPGGETFEIALYDNDKVVARKSVKCANSGSGIVLPVKNMKLWSPESPFLYDIKYTVRDSKGEVLDEVKSYVGMRKVHTENGRVYLNNEPYYQRLVLNQGYYPDGLWTAPSDEALKNDIVLEKEAGFNGACLHEKVFEERFHYWADKLGFVTWGGSPNFGMNVTNEQSSRNFFSEWTEIITRDRNHPSIISWVPLHQPLEAITIQFLRLVSDTYKMTKAMDPSRPVITTAGDLHFNTDVWTIRNYESDDIRFRQAMSAGNKEPDYAGQPYIVGEFGGMAWSEATDRGGSWGYGGMITNEEAFYQRLEGFVNAIQANKDVAGFCYVQFTDIESEGNGVYYYDRRPKLNMKRIKAIFEQIPSRAEVEKKKVGKK